MEVPVLQTERLRLRAVITADVPAIKPFMYYNGLPLTSDAEVLEALKRIDTDIKNGQSLNWGLEQKTETGLIGTVGFYRGFKDFTGEIGYVLHKPYQQMGFMHEAVEAVLHYGFQVLQLRYIVAYTSEDNLPSQKLLQKAGFNTVISDNGNYLKFSLSKPGLL